MNRAINIALALAGTTLLPGCGEVQGPKDDGSRGAIAACEDATLKTLRSPSSYARVWADFTEREPLDAAEQRQWKARSRCSQDAEKNGACSGSSVDNFTAAFAEKTERELARKIRRGEKLTDFERAIADRNTQLNHKKTGFVLLEYDAENAFGAAIRQFGICRFGPPGAGDVFHASDIFQIGPVPRGEGESAKAISLLAQSRMR